MPWFSWVNCLYKENWTVLKTIQERHPEKTWRRRLCGFERSMSPYNLVIVSDVFLLALLSNENLHSFPGSGMKSLFTGIHSSSHTAVSSTQVIYSFMSFFKICLFILLSLLYFFSNRSLGTFFHGFRIPFPGTAFHILVLPWSITNSLSRASLVRLRFFTTHE